MKKNGIILTEALVAITTLATGMIALGTMTSSAVSTTILSKDYLFAHNILTEGIEVVKNIRSTNNLRYNNEKTCWLSLNDDCNKIKNNIKANFIITLTDDLWQLNDGPSAELDLTTYNPDDPDDVQNNYQVYIGGQKSKFFRSVVFTEADDDNATFELKIKWKNGEKINTITKNIKMFNN